MNRIPLLGGFIHYLLAVHKDLHMQRKYKSYGNRLRDLGIDVAAGLEGKVIGAHVIGSVAAAQPPLKAGVIDRLKGVILREGDVLHGGVVAVRLPDQSVLIDAGDGNNAGLLDVAGRRIDFKHCGIGIFVAADIEHRFLFFIAVNTMDNVRGAYQNIVDRNRYVTLKITPYSPIAEVGFYFYACRKVVGAAVIFIGVGFTVFIDAFMKIGRGIEQLLFTHSPAAFAVDAEISVIPNVGVVGNGDMDFNLVALVG